MREYKLYVPNVQSDIEEIVNKSQFIRERLNEDIPHLDQNFNKQDSEQRLKTWMKVVAKGEEREFAKYLSWNNWAQPEIIQVLGTHIQEQTLPNWANTLRDIVENLSRSGCTPLYPSPGDTKNPYPFEELLIPLIGIARKKLLKRLGCDSLPLNILTETAYLNLERGLLQKLFDMSVNTLEREFSPSRSFGHNFLIHLLQKSGQEVRTTLYQSFIEKNLTEGFLSLFKKYPVLARLIAITIDFWVENTANFIERLIADLGSISLFFLEEQPENLGNVIELNVGLSDFHNGHQSVIALTFSSGFKLIYKPKNLALEVSFTEFLAWCNREMSGLYAEDDLELKILQVLQRENYGWLEYVQQSPCEDKAAAKRFYQRAGMILCLLYLLGGTDFHNENLIACGEHLVLIDLETALHHEAKLLEGALDDDAVTLASYQLSDSVIRTGLLPTWEFAAENSIARDFSGLGSIENQPEPIPVPVWKQINTDDMHCEHENMDRPLQANIPMLDGQPLSPKDFINDLVTGFERMYRFLIDRRESLLSPGSPLDVFNSQRVRFIFRPTRIYGMVLNRIMTPEFLQHGLDWSLEIEVLSRSFLIAEDEPVAWGILSAEIKAMSRLDVPYFSAVVDSDALNLSGEDGIEEYFRASCRAQIRSRLRSFNEQNLRQQIEITRLAFYAKEARILQSDPDSFETREALEQPPLLTPSELVQRAEEIAEEIIRNAITGNDESLSWISLTYVQEAERFQLMPLGYSFYDGNCGIALFLAALASLTGKEKYRQTALRAIRPLQDYLRGSEKEEGTQMITNMGIGGGTGLGSIVYCLAKMSDFLQLPQLHSDALEIAHQISPAMIARDRKFDIIGGAAGAILGLLALETEAVLPAAIACGEHLLAYIGDVYQNRTPHAKGTIGFSHGAAGIAYALLRLYGFTGNSQYRQAAQEAIAYENLCFYADKGNWQEISPAYEPSAPPIFWSTWCHGAPGIALGRLGCLKVETSEALLQDAEIALKTTENTPLQAIDHLCCGNLGRAEIMLVASQKLSSSRWHSSAREVAAKVVHQAMKNGYYQLFSELPNTIHNPSFFQGAAGIGYQLLRLARPDIFPSVIMWE